MQAKKKVIAISGMPGAGKGVAAEAAKQLGLEVLVLGERNTRRDRAERIGADTEERGKRHAPIESRGGSRSGREETATQRSKLSASTTVVVEGIRSLHELAELRSRFEVVTVAIHASPESRFQRLLSRNRSDDPKTLGGVPGT